MAISNSLVLGAAGQARHADVPDTRGRQSGNLEETIKTLLLSGCHSATVEQILAQNLDNYQKYGIMFA